MVDAMAQTYNKPWSWCSRAQHVRLPLYIVYALGVCLWIMLWCIMCVQSVMATFVSADVLSAHDAAAALMHLPHFV